MIVPESCYAWIAPYPPLHPAHFWCIERYDGVRFPLEATRDPDWAALQPLDVKPSDCLQAQAMLDTWEASRYPLAHPDVQEWIAYALGYLRGMYADRRREEPAAWYDVHLRYLPERDPLRFVTDHAGTHFIQRFYPAYVLQAADVARAVWTPDTHQRMQTLRGVSLSACE